MTEHQNEYKIDLKKGLDMGACGKTEDFAVLSEYVLTHPSFCVSMPPKRRSIDRPPGRAKRKKGAFA